MPNYLPGTGPLKAAARMTVPRSTSAGGRLVVAGLLSSILPGAGQFLIGDRRKAIVLFLAYAILISNYLLWRLPKTLWGTVIPVPVLIAFGIFSTWDAVYNKPQEVRAKQWWLAALIPIACIAGLLQYRWLMPAAGFQAFSVPSVSMAPTIPEGSNVMVDCWYHRHTIPKRGDIVVASPIENVYETKRVIAVGGDTIEVRGDTVILNGHVLSEPYVYLDTSAPKAEDHVGPMVVPFRKIFLMGDNRHLSFDSRSAEFGLIDVSMVHGKVIYYFIGKKFKRLD